MPLRVKKTPGHCHSGGGARQASQVATVATAVLSLRMDSRRETQYSGAPTLTTESGFQRRRVIPTTGRASQCLGTQAEQGASLSLAQHIQLHHVLEPSFLCSRPLSTINKGCITVCCMDVLLSQKSPPGLTYVIFCFTSYYLFLVLRTKSRALHMPST